jgi:hypothetical protein
VPRGLGALLFLASTACATGQFPSSLAERPLVMPEGEHQLEFGIGYSNTVELSGIERPRYGLIYGYRYGITEGLDARFPLILSYALIDDEDLELAVRAGVYAIGLTYSRKPAPFSGDPRDRPPAANDLFWFAPGLALSMLIPTESGAWRANVFAAQRLSIEAIYGGALNGFIGYAFDLSEWISISLNVGGNVIRSEDDRFFSTIGVGSGEDGGQYVPLVSFHLSDQVDLFGTAGLYYGLVSKAITSNFAFGVDWHFD